MLFQVVDVWSAVILASSVDLLALYEFGVGQTLRGRCRIGTSKHIIVKGVRATAG